MTEPTPTNAAAAAAANLLGATAAYWAALDALVAAGKAYADHSTQAAESAFREALWSHRDVLLQLVKREAR